MPIKDQIKNYAKKLVENRPNSSEAKRSVRQAGVATIRRLHNLLPSRYGPNAKDIAPDKCWPD